jgi:hypothetical protein
MDVAPEDKSSDACRFFHHIQQAKEVEREAARISARNREINRNKISPHSARLDVVPDKSSPGYRLYQIAQASFRGLNPDDITTPSTPQPPKRPPPQQVPSLLCESTDPKWGDDVRTGSQTHNVGSRRQTIDSNRGFDVGTGSQTHNVGSRRQTIDSNWGDDVGTGSQTHNVGRRCQTIDSNWGDDVPVGSGSNTHNAGRGSKTHNVGSGSSTPSNKPKRGDAVGGGSTSHAIGNKKHLIDLIEGDGNVASLKKAKYALCVEDADVFHSDKPISSPVPQKHTLCFHGGYLAKLAKACKSTHPRPNRLLVQPTRDFVTYKFRPIFESVRVIKGIDQKNVAGNRMLISVDQHGLESTTMSGNRFGPNLQQPNIPFLETKLPRSNSRYFDHAAWFIECTNLNAIPKKCFGLAIAVLSYAGTEADRLDSTQVTVDLGFVICLNAKHFIYALFNPTVLQDPQSKHLLPSYLMLTPDHCNGLLSDFMDNAFLGPFRMDPNDFANPKCRKRVIFLNQMAGRAISSLQCDPDHIEKMKLCTNEIDGGFQCAYLGPSHLIPPTWRFPFQQEKYYHEQTSEECGDIDKPRLDSSHLEGQHSFFNKKQKVSHPSCNFKDVISLDKVCKTLFVLKDTRPSQRLDGPCLVISSTGQSRFTTTVPYFYMPYLEHKNATTAHVVFAMVSPADFKCKFVSTTALRSSGMDLKQYHMTLSSISKADICLPIIDQGDHPGGFRICLCDPEDKDETAQFDKISLVVNTMNGESDSTSEPVITQDLKRVNRNPGGDHLNWTNNYTLPWLTLFRSFPWTRKTGLTTRSSDLFLNAYGSGFSDRKGVNHVGQTIYQGVRAGKALRLSPTLGVSEADRHQYYREESYIPVLLPPAEKIANKLFKSSSNFMRWLDPAFDSFLKTLPRTQRNNHYCRVKLITQGVPYKRKRRKGNSKDLLVTCLGWSSSDHNDKKNDQLPADEQVKLTSSLHKWQPKPREERLIKQYLQKFGHRHTFGVPTCCGYEYVGLGETDSNFSFSNVFENKSMVIHHYFVISGLRCAVRLRPDHGTDFFAHTFAHCTSICVATFQGRVYFSDDHFRAFSWGGGGA